MEQGEVMLLQQVRQKVSAHKAFMITNVGFTAGAAAAAKDEGIALHIVTPEFETSVLPRGDRVSTLKEIQRIGATSSGQVFSHRVEHRGLGFTGRQSAGQPPRGPGGAPRHVGYETRVQQGPAPRGGTGPPSNRAMGAGESRGGRSPGSDRSGGRGTREG